MSNELKACPYCAETIKATAIVCRFCHRELLPQELMAVERKRQEEETQRQLEAERARQVAREEEQRRNQEEVERERAARRPGDVVTNSLGMKFAWCPPGSFVMGDDFDDGAKHKVTLTKGFYIGIVPVTQGQWSSLMRINPSQARYPDYPVERVSHAKCVEFCNDLNWSEKASIPRRTYRLPTEAEWEYACRAGTTTKFSFGNIFKPGLANCPEGVVGVFGRLMKLAGGMTSVGSFPPNAWGIYDMHGNVGELCQDSYAAFAKDDVTDPLCTYGFGPVVRGGKYSTIASGCSSAARTQLIVDAEERWTAGNDGVGFRIVLCMD